MNFDLERYNRLLGVLPRNVLTRLNEAHVLIAGVGGTGGQIALDLARLGVGHLTLADFDVYERHNMNRQAGCFESTLGRPKIEVIGRMCRDVNPRLRIHLQPEGVTANNAFECLQARGESPCPGFIAELIDISALPAKRALYAAANDMRVPCLTAPMIGFGAALFVFRHGSTGFEETLADGSHFAFDRLVPALGSYMDQNAISGGVAGSNTVPTCGIGANLASALIVSEIVRGLMYGQEHMLAAPQYRYVDFIDFQMKEGRLETTSNTILNEPGAHP